MVTINLNVIEMKNELLSIDLELEISRCRSTDYWQNEKAFNRLSDRVWNMHRYDNIILGEWQYL